MEIKKEKFLNIEEADNLQDMINFAASIKDQKDNKASINLTENKINDREDINSIYPVESLYSMVMVSDTAPNKELDKGISDVLNE